MTAPVGPSAARTALMEAYGRAGLPWTCQIDVTYRCDLDCQHCYLDDREHWPELTTAEWRSVFDQLAELGVFQVAWSGGELLLRSDLMELLAHAKSKGFVSSLRSHAGLVTPDIAAQWHRLGVESVRASIYSLDEALHDAFTRRPGSLRATLAGLGHLVKAGVPIQVDAVLQAATVEEVPAMVQFFGKMGAKIDFSTNIYRDHLGREKLDLLDLTSAQRIRARELIWQHQSGDVDIHLPVASTLSQGACGAGRHYLHITPDGAVWPCVMFPMALGHLREHSLRDIWDNSPERQAILQWKNKDRGACTSCGGSDVCFYCPGEAYKHTGDFKVAPAHFHARTRDMMQALERARGPRYSVEQWASVPEGGARSSRPTGFQFPIYRPSKHGGARVGTKVSQ